MNVRDSKKLSPEKREALAPEIEKCATSDLLGHRAAVAGRVPDPQTRRIRRSFVMREMLEDLIRKFNAKVASDPALRAELVGLRKTVLIELKDGTKYHFTLADQKVAGLLDGGVDTADITISTDADTLRGLILREIGPFKAYATGKIKLKGSLEDLARFRKFF